MRIAIFDYKIIPTNPIGSCHLRMIKGLCLEHDFTVFACEFENPDPSRIQFVRVPSPARPLAATFVFYHLLAPLAYLWHRLTANAAFDVVQMVESNSLVGCDISYAHFCHRRFLKQHWPAIRKPGLRGFLRWLDHWLHSLMEPWVFRKATEIVVPSRGLARELEAEYPWTAGKIHVLANPVDLARMKRPDDFDRSAARTELGFAADDIVIAFLALGHFERKGLPLLMEAIAAAKNPKLKLCIVGGEGDLVKSYQARATELAIKQQTHFAGMQKDVRKYLWTADAFALPSVYEVFPLVALEAAAAGLPIIASPLNGVEEFARDGVNSLIVERTASGVLNGINRLLALSAEARVELGRQAQQDVQRYSVELFCTNWRGVYQRRQSARPVASALPDPHHRL